MRRKTYSALLLSLSLSAASRGLRGRAELQAARVSRPGQPSLRHRAACDRPNSPVPTLADVKWFDLFRTRSCRN